jgi:hypothetical protein
MMRLKNILLAVVVITISCPTWAGATDLIPRESLKGLNGINVLIEQLRPEVETLGLTREQLQSDVELRFRMAGIRVASNDEEGLLTVSLTGAGTPRGGRKSWYFSLLVSYSQLVSLVRAPDIRVVGTTWSRGFVGRVWEQELIRTLRDTVSDLVDEFINDYLAVNPKK